jgi:hypothetical protein
MFEATSSEVDWDGNEILTGTCHNPKDKRAHHKEITFRRKMKTRVVYWFKVKEVIYNGSSNQR